MPNTKASVAATGTGVRSRPRAVLPALCLTQITSWGVLSYAFPVLNPTITHATGWRLSPLEGTYGPLTDRYLLLRRFYGGAQGHALRGELGAHLVGAVLTARVPDPSP